MTLLITNAGIAAAIRADNMGLNCKITHIGIGLEGYAPSKTQTALRDEICRKAITRANSPALGQLHFEVQFDEALSYEAREIGYYFEDGTLFAIDSKQGEIMSIKQPNSIVVEAFDLNLSDSSISNIIVELLDSPCSTETVSGIAKIASQNDVELGTDDKKIITPKKAAATFARRTDQYPVGAPIPWFSDVLPDGHCPMDGRAFDKIMFPQLGRVYTTGILPNTTGQILKHVSAGRAVMSFELDEVKTHSHNADFLGEQLGEHSHPYLMMNTDAKWDLTRTNTSSDPDGQLISTKTLETEPASAGRPAGRVSVQAFGTTENLVKNIGIIYIVRLA